MIDDPVVITCAISGVIANRDQCPAIPYTPQEYGQEARRAVQEGAAMIHIHARKPDGTPSYEIEDFLAITEAIRSAAGDVIINYSTGTIGVPVEKRVAYLEAGLPEVAALNMGSMNYAKYSASRKSFVFEMVFANPFSEIVELLTAMNELQIRPEHECFDVGHVGSLAPLLDMGVLKAPLHVDCIMGVVGGIPRGARNLATMVENIPGLDGHANGGQRSHWGVIGISRDQWMLLGAALSLGGSVRVGLEDNLYLPDGSMARSNGDLIAKARQMVEDVGRRPATVEEARALLGVRRREMKGTGVGGPAGEGGLESGDEDKDVDPPRGGEPSK
jgi:3-keto-5-aminohexanoate cleavage enzyme